MTGGIRIQAALRGLATAVAAAVTLAIGVGGIGVGGSGVGAAGSPAGAHPRPSAASGYVALGDSYAAGEGLPPFDTGTAGPGGCHRSVDQSYPALLADSSRRVFANATSVACSGAVTADLVAKRPGGTQAPQLSALSPSTRTVTVTIGGNDAGFGLIFLDCVSSPDPALQAALPGSAGCRGRNEDAVRTRIEALAGGRGAPTVPGIVPLPVLLRQIQSAAPRATIYLTGYPRIFGRVLTDDHGCRVSEVAPLYVSGSDTRWIRRAAADLNSAIQSAAKRARANGADVRYVDAAAAFRGHDLCDRKSSWVNGVVLTPAPPSQPPQISGATFHPTARGQQAYADAVSDAVPARREHPRPWN